MNPVVFITGAAMGIGAATAKLLHARGAKRALFDVHEQALRKTAAEIGADGLCLAGDVGRLADLEPAMARTQRQFGRLDAVFANAGIARMNPIVSMDEAEWSRVIDVDRGGVWRTLKAAAPHLLASRGCVLVTSPAAASVCLPLGAHDTASKAGVLNLAEAYRREMGGFGIEVGTLPPMYIRTARWSTTRSGAPTRAGAWRRSRSCCSWPSRCAGWRSARRG
jgi:NAD(P)-dependent dehydrogenase (short-subunit alcohol dehydrogenase family)